MVQEVEIHRAAGPSRWLVSCDHATNRIPEAFGGTLGLPPEEMARHIAYDVGARGVALEVARLLDAPAVLARFSRLVIDPNRGEDDPTLVMQLYDGTLIPGNRWLDAAALEARKALCYRPYHAAYAALAAARPDRVICAVHSFTAGLRGRAPRPWHLGILHSHLDSRLAIPLIERLRHEPDIVVGDNQPYDGHLPGDAIDRHSLAHGRPNVLVELRQDLIETEAGQIYWARRLAPILAEVLAASHL
jgi:predicted N-formylglutamate amidohydrolase